MPYVKSTPGTSLKIMPDVEHLPMGFGIPWVKIQDDGLTRPFLGEYQD